MGYLTWQGGTGYPVMRSHSKPPESPLARAKRLFELFTKGPPEIYV